MSGLSTQNDIAWQLAKQSGKLIGKDTKAGFEYDPSLFPTWDEYINSAKVKLDSDLAQTGVDQMLDRNPKESLLSEPSRKSLTNEVYVKEVHEYAKEWRKRVSDRKTSTKGR